jgi:uncharacterized membrane protein YsdA (DUF1294 family)
MDFIRDHLAVCLVLSYAVIINLITFILYGHDKSLARKGARRIPEATLHKLALAGGSMGALIGQKVFHHKTQKLKFQIVFWLTVVLQGTLLLGCVYLVYMNGD